MAFEYQELFGRLLPRVFGTAAPGAGTWRAGSVVWNEAVAAGGPTGWVCISAGSPGTWAPFGFATEVAATAISAAGSISPSSTVVDVATGGFNITLTAPTTQQDGAVINIVNDTASACTLVGATGVTLYAGSAVISANSQAQVKAVGGNYYRIA